MPKLANTAEDKVYHALIVEPSGLYQGIYERILLECQFKVSKVTTAQEAYQQLNEHQYDLIILAKQLPDEDGTHLCMKLRANEATAHISIIMIIAQESQEVIQLIMLAGATEVLYKDESEELRRYIVRTFQNKDLLNNLGGRILYIENQKSIATHTIWLLENNGYEVQHFTTAEDALTSLQQRDYELILTDILFDGKKTGLSMVRDIKAMQGRVAEIPILAVTSMDDSKRKIDLLYQGINDYIKKPVIDDELLARVANLVKMQHLRDEVENQKKEILKLAMQDQLTKLYNRHYLMDVGARKISEATRHAHEMSLMVIDLDHFKDINDRYGHSAGDKVLHSVAETIKSLTRAEDICARFGGEEFVIIMSHCNSESALQKAEELRVALEKNRIGPLSITASIGVTSLPKGQKLTFQNVFDSADKAVYQAKANGRNQVVFRTLDFKDSKTA